MGLLVMVSARGDMSAASSGKLGLIVTCLSGVASLSTRFGGGPRFREAKPKPLSLAPTLCAANPGEGGGFGKDIGGGKPGDIGGLDMSSAASPGDGGGLDIRGGASLGDRVGLDNENGASPGDGGGLEIEAADETGPKSGCGGGNLESTLNRPNLPGSDSSSFCFQEKVEGAEDGPGEMGSPRLGVEFPRARTGLLSGLTRFNAGPTAGSGAVSGSFGAISMLSADMVALCFVGLFPDRGLRPALGESLLLQTSFWKSCRQYISFMLGLIHLLFAWAA